MFILLVHTFHQDYHVMHTDCASLQSKSVKPVGWIDTFLFDLAKPNKKALQK